MRFEFSKHMWDNQTGIHKITQEMVDGAICKGCLKKQGANWKTWRTRYFILTENVLYYLSSLKNGIPLGAILLANTVVEGADETIDKPWCFLVKCKKSYTGTIQWSNRTYYLQATDYVDMNKWIEALLSKPVRLSQQIFYHKLSHLCLTTAPTEGDSIIDALGLMSPRANTNTGSNPNTRANTNTSTNTNPNPIPSSRANTANTTNTFASGDASTSAPAGSPSQQSISHLSEFYTLDSPSCLLLDYSSCSSSESNCEDTESSFAELDASGSF